MIDAIRSLIRPWVCKHHWILLSAIYGGHINHYNARTFWRCAKCGAGRYSKTSGPPGDKP